MKINITKNPPKKLLSEIQKLAHGGTKDALHKLYKMREEHKDEETQNYLYIAIGECQLFYYTPQNESDDNDMHLAMLINYKQSRLDKLYMDIEKFEAKLEIDKIDSEVHKKVMSNASKDDAKEWKYNEPILGLFGERYEENVKYAKYLEEWIKQAKDMIKNEKYKDVPASHLASYDVLGIPNSIDDENDLDDDCCKCPACKAGSDIPFDY